MNARPLRHLLAILTIAALTACGGGADDAAPAAVAPPSAPSAPAASAPATPKVRVFVVDAAAAPLADVRAEVVGSSGSAMTGADGGGSFELAATRSVLVKFSKAGYADNFRRAAFAAGATEAIVRIGLLPRTAAQAVDAATGGSVAGRDGASVDLPAGGLVDAETGASLSGMVDVALTPVDVSGPERRSFPGTFAGIDESGVRQLIASYGTTEFALSQGGRRVNLAPGRSATIEMPIYTPLHAPGRPVVVGDVIPLWSLDESTGVWKQEGTGTVVAHASSPTGLAMRATVGHFSWWNCDVAVETGRFDLDLETPDVSDDDRVDEDRPPDLLDVVELDPNKYSFGADKAVHIDATTADDSFLVAAGIDFESVFLGQNAGPDRRFAAGVVSPVLENWVIPANRVMAVSACATVKRGGNRFGPITACGTVHATIGVDQRVKLTIRLVPDDLRNMPHIASQPSSTTVEPGAAASFAVDAVRALGGKADLTYQWNRNGVPIAGATASTYTTPATSLADHNVLYSVAVTAPPGAVLSRPARLSVVAPPPPPPPPNSGLDRWADAVTGNDANPGTAAAPYRRISTAIANVASGGTVWLNDGTWDESIDANLHVNGDGLNCSRGNVSGGSSRGDPLVTGTTIRAVNAGRATVRFNSWFAFCLGDTRLVGVVIEGASAGGIHAVFARRSGSTSSLSGVAWSNGMVYVENGARLTIEPAGLASYGNTGKIQSTALTGQVSSVRVQGLGSEVVVRGGAFDRMVATGGSGTTIQVSDCPSNAALFAFRGGRLVLEGVDVRKGPRQTGDDPVANAIGVCMDGSVELNSGTSIYGFAPWGAAVAMGRGTLLVAAGSLLSGNQYGVFARNGSTGARASISLDSAAAIESSLADGIFVETTLSQASGVPSLTLAPGTAIRGSGRHGIALEGSSAGNTGVDLAIDGATVTGNAGAGIDVQSSRSCSVRNTTLTGNIEYGIHLHGSARCDLGSGASPGGNTLRNTGPNLRIAILDHQPNPVDISAVGNTWHANEQGADGQGRYVLPAGQTTPLVLTAPVTTGNNVRLHWWGPGYTPPTLKLAE